MPTSERYDALLRSLPHAVYALDLQTREVLFANRCDFLGYNCQELSAPGSILHEVADEDRSDAQAFWQALITLPKDEIIDAECRVRRKDGGWEWIQMRGTVGRREADRTPREVTLVLSIITPSKEAEYALQEYGDSMAALVAEKTDELRTLIETSPDAIMRVDVQGNLLMANRQAAHLFGYEDVEQMYTEVSHVAMLLAPEERNRFAEVKWNAREVQSADFAVMRRNGFIFWAEVRAAFRRDEAGNPMEATVVVRDITERKAAEREKVLLFEQVKRHREQLRVLTARLAEAEETERRRLAHALHDLVGQNLTTLNVNLNIVQARCDDSLISESIDLVEQTTKQIRQIMSDLRPPALDDLGLLAALKWYGARLASKGGFRFVLEGTEPDPPLPVVENTVLFRAAQEALTNVLKHAQASEVTVSVDADVQRVQVVVQDDGVGFEMEDLEIWETDRGWGLIFMTERIAVMGGNCRVESHLGEGTRVIMEILR